MASINWFELNLRIFVVLSALPPPIKGCRDDRFNLPNSCRSNTLSGWPQPRSICQSEPLVTPMTVPWPNASSIRALSRPHWGHGHPQMFNTEVINQIGPLKSLREVEWETLKWPYSDASIAYRLAGRLL